MTFSLLLALPAKGHEKWFTTRPVDHMDPHDLVTTPVIIGLVIVAVATVAGWILSRMRGGREIIPGPKAGGATPAGLRIFYAIAPAILGLHLAVPLFVYGLQGRLFTPNNLLPAGWYSFARLAEAMVGLSFFYGFLTRPAAIMLALLWLGGIAWRGPLAMLENLHYLGFAGFFFLGGRGPFSIDRLLLPRLEPRAKMVALAPLALRVGVGLSLAVVAFSEKLANLDLSRSFLQQYPLNFTPAWHVPMSDSTFAVWAGCIELLAGLCIALGIFPRVIILIAWLPINLSLTVFNWVELVGHLPFYGAIAFLFVWTPDEENGRLWKEGVMGIAS